MVYNIYQIYMCVFVPSKLLPSSYYFRLYNWIPSDVCLSAHIELQVTNIDGDFCTHEWPLLTCGSCRVPGWAILLEKFCVIIFRSFPFGLGQTLEEKTSLPSSSSITLAARIQVTRGEIGLECQHSVYRQIFAYFPVSNVTLPALTCAWCLYSFLSRKNSPSVFGWYQEGESVFSWLLSTSFCFQRHPQSWNF